jgi:U3 small nucleolar RNA-associated protein 18
MEVHQPSRSRKRKSSINLEHEHDLEEIIFSSAQDVVQKLKVPESDTENHDDLQTTESESTSVVKKTKPTEVKKAAWIDSDDEILVSEGLAGVAQLPRRVTEDQKFKTYQEEKFKSIYKTPKWAEDSHKKRKRHDDSSSEDDDDDGVSLSTVARKVTKIGSRLARGNLNFKKCTALNCDLKRSGRLYNSVIFHPKFEIGIVSTPKIVDVFKVQNKGKFSNDRTIKSYGFTQTFIERIAITPDGKELLLGTKFPYSSSTSIDMETGKTRTFSTVKNLQDIGLRRLCISADGRLLACKGDRGSIFIMDNQNKEFIREVNMNDECEDLSFTPDSQSLITHGVGGQCYIWDIKSSKLIHKFYDEGVVVGTSIAISPNQQFLATGSEAGVVNLYDYKSVLNSGEDPVTPLKSFMNLTTAVTRMKFNHSSELLAFCSTGKVNSVKVAHVSSRSVFSNFPLNESYGRVNDVNFSPTSGFLAFSGSYPEVSLFRLCHFQSY